MQSTLEPVTRGGAGGSSRLTSGTTAGPACAHQRVTRFTFAIRWAKSRAARAKRAAAVAEHLEEVPGAVVVEERAEGARLWLTVAVWPPLRADDAERVAEGCPDGTERSVGD
jgi:hypothetical protein